MKITNGILDGPVGALEYILNIPEQETAPRRAAVLCHPHPLQGGTMHTRIVFHAARTLAELGIPVLRFHFRGVGQSAGVYAGGIGEVEDACAAMAWMRQRFPVPLVLGGFSFGSVVGLQALARPAGTDVSVERYIGLGLPASFPGRLPQALHWHGPKLFISGTQDSFGTPAAISAYVAGLDEPKRIVWIEGADHFLSGRMDEFAVLLRENLDFETALGKGNAHD
ncbi:MAG: alpha/beta hydrolase [Terriglobales bacterium]